MDLALTRAEVEEFKLLVQRKRDEWEGDEAAEASADSLIEFTGVLLGEESMDSFLRSQDMAD